MTTMTTMTEIDPEVIATRSTSDGVTVHLHEDGSVSTRFHFFRTRLALDVAHRVMDDVCLYDMGEVPGLLREVKKGSYAKKGRPVKRGTGRIDPCIRRRQMEAITCDRRVGFGSGYAWMK